MSMDSTARPTLPPEPQPAPGRSPDEIEKDIETRRERLEVTVNELTIRAKPATMVQRAKVSAKNAVIDENGKLRIKRVLPVAGAVAGVVSLVAIRKATHRKPTKTELVKQKGSDAWSSVSDLAEKVAELLSQSTQSAKHRASEMWDATADVRGRTGDVAVSASETVKDAAHGSAKAAKKNAKQSNKAAKKLWKRLPWG